MEIEFNQTSDTHAFFDIRPLGLSGDINASSGTGEYSIEFDGYDEDEDKKFKKSIDELEKIVGIEANRQMLFYREYWYTEEVTSFFPFPENDGSESVYWGIQRKTIINQNIKDHYE